MNYKTIYEKAYRMIDNLDSYKSVEISSVIADLMNTIDALLDENKKASMVTSLDELSENRQEEE